MHRPPILPTTSCAPRSVELLVRAVDVVEPEQQQRSAPALSASTTPSAATTTTSATAIRHGSVLLVPHPPLAPADCSPAPARIDIDCRAREREVRGKDRRRRRQPAGDTRDRGACAPEHVGECESAREPEPEPESESDPEPETQLRPRTLAVPGDAGERGARCDARVRARRSGRGQKREAEERGGRLGRDGRRLLWPGPIGLCERTRTRTRVLQRQRKTTAPAPAPCCAGVAGTPAHALRRLAPHGRVRPRCGGRRGRAGARWRRGCGR